MFYKIKLPWAVLSKECYFKGEVINLLYGLVQYDEIVYETEEFKIERCLRSGFFNVTNDQVCEVLKKLNLLKEKEKIQKKNYQKTSIEKDGKKYFGLLDETGEHLLVPYIICADDCSFHYEDGYVIYRKGDSKGIMNLKGKVIVPARYSAIIPLNKYLAFALWDDGEFYN